MSLVAFMTSYLGDILQNLEEVRSAEADEYESSKRRFRNNMSAMEKIQQRENADKREYYSFLKVISAAIAFLNKMIAPVMNTKKGNPKFVAKHPLSFGAPQAKKKSKVPTYDSDNEPDLGNDEDISEKRKRRNLWKEKAKEKVDDKRYELSDDENADDLSQFDRNGRPLKKFKKQVDPEEDDDEGKPTESDQEFIAADDEDEDSEEDPDFEGYEDEDEEGEDEEEEEEEVEAE
jgi:hypothetical protein